MPVWLFSPAAKLIGILAIIAIVAIDHYMLVAKVAKFRADAAEYRAANERLQAEREALRKAIDDQNAAIQAAHDQSAVLEARAKAALEQAKQAEASRKPAVSAVQVWSRRSDETDCDSARRLLREVKR